LETFDEPVFLWSLSTRTEDTKKFMDWFRPEWLKDKTLVPILSAIYSFTKEHGLAPDLNTVEMKLKDEDNDAYEMRWKEALDKVKESNPSLSQQVYVLQQAKDVAIVRSFQQLWSDHDFQRNQSEFEGTAVLSEVNSWINSFAGSEEEGILNLKSAIEKLMQDSGWNNKREKIPIGIKPIDEWTAQGLRPGQLGIVMAPTGHGKSTALMNMSLHAAQLENKNVLLVTNELTTNEQTERYLARLRMRSLKELQDDPTIAYTSELDRYWTQGLQNKLKLQSLNITASTNDLEADIVRYMNIEGWKPDLLVIDFMERMRPVEKVNREKSWVFLGSIAQDLVRLAKRHNMVIWTACQTNRSGLASGAELALDMGQSSIQHFQEAAAVIAMKKETVNEQEALQFKELKMRHGAMSGRKMSLAVYLDKMFISKEEVKPEFENNEEAASPNAGGTTTWTKTKKKKT